MSVYQYRSLSTGRFSRALAHDTYTINVWQITPMGTLWCVLLSVVHDRTWTSPGNEQRSVVPVWILDRIREGEVE